MRKMLTYWDAVFEVITDTRQNKGTSVPESAWKPQFHIGAIQFGKFDYSYIIMVNILIHSYNGQPKEGNKNC